MEFVHEVTAYLENKPGRLAKICSALAQEKIDIRALFGHGNRWTKRAQADHERARFDQKRPHLAGNRVPRLRGAGSRARKSHRRSRQGAREAGRRTYQRRIRLCFDSSGAGQSARNLPHLQPETRLSDLERSRDRAAGNRPLRAAGAPCTRGRTGTKPRFARREPSLGVSTSGEEKKSPGCAPEEPPESDASQ